MKHRLFQYLGGIEGGSCALILAFLLLPYLVDVAYYRDLSPTHYAQENVNNNEDDRSHAKGTLLCPDDQAYSSEADIAQPAEDYVACTPAKGIFPPYYLFLASLTSRPPPVL